MPKRNAVFSPQKGNSSSKRKSSLAAHLWRATVWFDENLQQVLKERGEYTTTRTQSLVIANLGIGVSQPSRLARNIGISPQAMSQVLGDLVSTGLISVGPSADDGRARVVSLTDEGERYLSIVRVIFAELEGQLEERFGKPLIDIIRMVVEVEWDTPARPLSEFGGDG